MKLNKKHLISIIVLLININIFHVKADDNPFRFPYNNNLKDFEYNLSLTSTDSILLDTNQYFINGLSICGNVILMNYNSFIRVILEDVSGNEYQVLECSKMLFDKDTVSLDYYGEETLYLPIVKPYKLKFYIENSVLSLTNVRISAYNGEINNLYRQYIRSIAKTARYNQQMDNVQRINEYNIKHKTLWRADTTYLSLLPWKERKIAMGITDSSTNTGCIEYYAEGIYTLGRLSETNNDSLWHNNLSSEVYVGEFDWRNRHGKNWMTSVKNQRATNACWAFATVGSLEAVVNLYYNREIDMNLSEQELISCSRPNTSSSLIGGSPWNTLNWITNNGLINEEAFPFNPMVDSIPCSEQSDSISERVYIYGKKHVAQYPDSLKKYLINYGPMPISYRVHNDQGHAVVLTGFGKLKVGDGVVVSTINGSQTNTIEEGDPRIGMTYWICKDSYGTNIYSDGYIKLYLPGYDGGRSSCCIKNPLICMNYSDSDVAIIDDDGDGYYFWGIGPRPSFCPDWIPDTPDGDDSDYLYGPMDEYGFLKNLNPDLNDTIYIATDSICSHNKYIYNHTVIQNGGKLTLTSNIFFYQGVKLTVENGGILFVDGAIVKDADIKIESGGKIVIKNNGIVNICANKHFSLPLGAIMEIYSGIITP